MNVDTFCTRAWYQRLAAKTNFVKQSEFFFMLMLDHPNFLDYLCTGKLSQLTLRLLKKRIVNKLKLFRWRWVANLDSLAKQRCLANQTLISDNDCRDTRRISSLAVSKMDPQWTFVNVAKRRLIIQRFST